MYKTGTKFVLRDSSLPEYNGKVFMYIVVSVAGLGFDGIALMVCLEDGKYLPTVLIKIDDIDNGIISKEKWKKVTGGRHLDKVNFDTSFPQYSIDNTITTIPRSIKLRL
jgi:hypothetical protein